MVHRKGNRQEQKERPADRQHHNIKGQKEPNVREWEEMESQGCGRMCVRAKNGDVGCTLTWGPFGYASDRDAPSRSVSLTQGSVPLPLRTTRCHLSSRANDSRGSVWGHCSHCDDAYAHARDAHRESLPPLRRRHHPSTHALEMSDGKREQRQARLHGHHLVRQTGQGLHVCRAGRAMRLCDA